MYNNKLYIRLTFFLLLAGSICHAQKGLSLEDEAFILRYSPPHAVTAILDEVITEAKQKKDNYKHSWNLVWSIDQLPGYLIKYRIDRIKGMEAMQECIEKHHLDRLTVPRKFLYHIKGADWELTNSNYIVIAEKVDGKQAYTFDDEEIRQICILLTETGYNDFVSENVFRLSNNKLCFIDTEGRDFDRDENYKGLARIFTWYSRFKPHSSFSEASLKLILTELFACSPDEKSDYKNLYNTVQSFLISYEDSMTWDYLTFFEEIFSKPE